jgi:hypothetical protein
MNIMIMNIMILSAAFGALLFAGVLGCIRLVWLIGRKHEARFGKSVHEGPGTIEGAVFGLMGLLIAFTFIIGAATRFDSRRALITQQVNAIETA